MKHNLMEKNETIILLKVSQSGLSQPCRPTLDGTYFSVDLDPRKQAMAERVSEKLM